MSKNTGGKSWTKQQHSYAIAEVGVARERSTFMRPSRTLTAIDGAFIYPVYVDEVLPGDTFQMSAGLIGRLATPLKPFMDRLYIDVFYFFVPNRLLWQNWKKFQGEKRDPGDSSTFTVPQIEIAGGAGGNTLADYMGIPIQATTFKVNAMPFRAYNLIYNEFFRDTNLQDSVVTTMTDADSMEADYVLLKRGKRKDYITSCLPWPQRPGVGVTPGIISGTVPVTSTGMGGPKWKMDGVKDRLLEAINTAGTVGVTGPAVDIGDGLTWDEDAGQTGLEAVLDTAQANTINQLRQSIAIQQLLELDARGGARYTEQLKARFGVTSPDHRLQRPEYLGGGHVNINVTSVPATNSEGSTNQGDLAGYGVAQGNAGGFTKSFTEHGIILGLVNLRADYTYFEGVPRFWSRQTRYDYYEPALAHLGEQAVLNQEVFVSNDANDVLVFGYQERFSEYKYGNSMVTSVMRPNNTVPLDVWHLAEEFGSLPTLNATFIEENPPIDRVTIVGSQPNLILDMYFQNRCTRVMPVFNTPGLQRL